MQVYTLKFPLLEKGNIDYLLSMTSKLARVTRIKEKEVNTKILTHLNNFSSIPSIYNGNTSIGMTNY